MFFIESQGKAEVIQNLLLLLLAGVVLLSASLPHVEGVPPGQRGGEQRR